VAFRNIIDQVAISGQTRHNSLSDGEFTCTYGETPALLNAIERYLTEQGVESGARVAVECVNSLAGALLMLTLLRKGGSFALTPAASGAMELKPAPRFCSHRLTVTPSPPSAGSSWPTGSVRVAWNPEYNGAPVVREKVYLRTSGSMGTSKIVVHAHEKLIGNARNCAGKYGFSSSTRAAVPAPIAHMYGFGAEFLPAVMSGASIDLQEKTNLLKYLDRERRFQPTIAFATPAICEMLLKGYKSPRTHYAAFVTSGQRIGEELFRAFDPWVSGRLINQYGSTEMGAIAACDPGDPVDRRATTIGTPMPGVQLRLEMPMDEAQACGSAGELHCNHPFGYEGYVDEDGDLLWPPPPDGWYRTGDLAIRHPDGSLVVTGRADASVNRSGYLVNLSDIEQMMEKLETLAGVAVVAGSGEGRQGQRIAAFCVARPGVPLDGAQVRQRCFDLLPHYAIPDEVRVIETLPLLPSGKIDRRMLEALCTAAAAGSR
jgi:acyl-coenzyme A synthetase/AMP-(fatty) acid ligase